MLKLNIQLFSDPVGPISKIQLPNGDQYNLNATTLGGKTLSQIESEIPANYVASASVSGNTLTLTPSSGSSVTFTNTTYESKTASSGGTDVSLVTTGEKYTWNSKVSSTMGYEEIVDNA